MDGWMETVPFTNKTRPMWAPGLKV